MRIPNFGSLTDSFWSGLACWTKFQWQPTLGAHDPDPPINLLGIQIQPRTGNLTITGNQQLVESSDTQLQPLVGVLTLTGNTVGVQNLVLTQVSQVVVETVSADIPGWGEVSQLVVEVATHWEVNNQIEQLVVEVADGSVSPQQLGQVVVEILELVKKFAPTSGVLQITGNTPTVETTLPLWPSSGSLLITGNEPPIGLVTFLVPESGSLLFTGSTVPIVVDHLFFPLAGELVVVGEQPVLQFSITVIPFSGELLFTGEQPGISQGVVLSPDSGSILITGEQPGVLEEEGETGITLTPLAGSLLITGQSPLLACGIAITSGALIITGQDPVVVSFTTARISQVVVESVSYDSVGVGRVSQVVVETVSVIPREARVSQVVVETLSPCRYEEVFVADVFGILTWIEWSHITAGGVPQTIVFAKVPLADPGDV